VLFEKGMNAMEYVRKYGIPLSIKDGSDDLNKLHLLCEVTLFNNE